MQTCEYDFVFCMDTYEDFTRLLNEKATQGWRVISAEIGNGIFRALLERAVVSNASQ